jgi:hypothetical protein
VIVVVAYIGAGMMDLFQRQWKLGTIAILFAISNAVIFLWRSGTSG